MKDRNFSLRIGNSSKMPSFAMMWQTVVTSSLSFVESLRVKMLKRGVSTWLSWSLVGWFKLRISATAVVSREL